MKILVADDDATSRLRLRAIVSKLGHDCLTANDGDAAWDMLLDGGVDVLLTDWMMPGPDGPELCRRIRSDIDARYVYVVLVTALDYPDQVLEGMRAGADDYLIKPANPFSVQTRLMAAERVTGLHQRLRHVQQELEAANAHLVSLSLTDPLTGLGNRRRMEQDLRTAHIRALRVGRPYALALYDIDHFKPYNDHYGHPAGDETLLAVATHISSAARAGENFYRYGGEEFLQIIPDCDLAKATVTAERILHAVRRADISHRVRATAPPVVTLSGGVSSWTPGSLLTYSEVLRAADDALLIAKTTGRARVVARPAESEVPAPV